jgi:hypothetical protein
MIRSSSRSRRGGPGSAARPFWRAVLVLAAILAASLAPAVRADEPLAAPAGEPLLTISGKIARTNKDGEAVFDRAMLEALGTVTIDTANPWVKGVAHYEGVPVSRVLKAVGAQGSTLVAKALDNYTGEIPMADFADERVILALKENGAYLTPRNKGPLFIVYPFDTHPEFRTELYFSRSIWQLNRIEVK